MVERKAFLANRKHQYHGPQYREHDCGAQSYKVVDCYKNPSLTHLIEELCF